MEADMTTLPRKADTILVADDEPYNLQWVVEFLEDKDYKVSVVDNVDFAIRQLQEIQFRAVIADLSIPLLIPDSLLEGKDPLFQRYPGLLIAEYARNHGHLGRQVIVYSVHDDPMVHTVAKRIGCTYLMKGRPRQFKEELEDVLSYDPLAQL
jgi:CheY-like chemotaxis protein